MAQVSIESLAWMTGNWRGPAGDSTLEERWNTPLGGSIQSLVRMTGEAGTHTFEMIVIEEENDSLVLTIQQWDPGMNPRTGILRMNLIDQSDNSVAFEAPEGSFITRLQYTRPANDQFVIDLVLGQGPELSIPLSPISD